MSLISNINLLFEHIFVINLDHRIDRFKLVDYKLKKKKINYTRFSAIDGYLSEQTNISSGAFGLILTYQKLLTHAINSNFKRFLIFEDDINFHHNFDEMVEAKKDLITNGDVVYLGANQLHYNKIEDGYYNLSDEYTCGTYAISMTIDFAKILLQALKMNLPIDVQIYELAKNYDAKVIFPFLILPDVTDSDTSSKRDMIEFCASRKYNINDYHLLTLDDLNNFKISLNDNNISLRQLFYPYRMNEYVSYDIFPPTINIEIIKKFMGEKLNWSELLQITEEFNPFVFIIPSYNNIENYQINLSSIISQNYPQYLIRILYISDCSDDGTDEGVKSFVKENKLENRFHFFRQKVRSRQGLARYQMFHYCFPDEFILLLDGDDWLFNQDVVSIIDQHIFENNLLVTYGSYYTYTEGNKEMNNSYESFLECVRSFPKDVIDNKLYKNYDWISGHLRGGFAYLFQKLKLNDLLDHEGKFPLLSSDLNEMLSVLEMAGNRHGNICKPTMIYNKENSIKYDTSFFNTVYDDYRDIIGKKIRSRNTYPTIDKFEIFDGTEIERWCKITDGTFVDCKPLVYNYVDPNNNLVVFHSDFNSNCGLASGIYLTLSES